MTKVESACWDVEYVVEDGWIDDGRTYHFQLTDANHHHDYNWSAALPLEFGAQAHLRWLAWIGWDRFPADGHLPFRVFGATYMYIKYKKNRNAESNSYVYITRDWGDFFFQGGVVGASCFKCWVSQPAEISVIWARFRYSKVQAALDFEVLSKIGFL